MPTEAEFIKLAIDNARKSTPEDARVHPKVGVVVQKEGRLLTQAYRGETEPGNHGEYIALEQKLAKEDVAGATVYTTLEPCTSRRHPKIPCAQRLVERRVHRVVIGLIDPNPDISGRGVATLRRANVAVELFPAEFMAQVEDLNRDFIRDQLQQTAQRAIDQDFLGRNQQRPLDDWYKAINRIFWNRNFHLGSMAIFTHLVEVIGGLSQLASDKEKLAVPPTSFVPKAIAWWMTLCGKLAITSVSDMLWAKFPFVCAYCHHPQHNPDVCHERKAARPGPDWDALAGLGEKNQAHRPNSLGEWQRMFSTIYPAQQTEGFGLSFARLTEELGELAEALRVFSAGPGYVLSEAADVLAWLMHIQNIIEQKAKTPSAQRGKALETTFCAAYPDRCLECGGTQCKCPPILNSTIGRIAHEVRRGDLSVVTGSFMSPEVARATFGSDRS